MRLKKMILLSLFISLALVLNLAEGMLPAPLPGIRLGTANVFTLAALELLGVKAAFTVTILRVWLAWLLTGNSFSLLCGIVGGLLSTVVMSLIYTKFRRAFSLPWISVAGAWAFNAGQIAVAAVLIGDIHVFYYFPPLLLAGTAAGWAVGALAETLAGRLKNILPQEKGYDKNENIYR